MQLFNGIRSEAAVILIFFLMLRLCRYKNIVEIDKDRINPNTVILFALLSLLEMLIMKLSGITNGSIVTGLFIIAFGCFSGTFQGATAAILFYFLITLFTIKPSIHMFVYLTAAGSAGGVMCRMLRNKSAGLWKNPVCCIFGSFVKFASCCLLYKCGYANLLRILFLDIFGSLITADIIYEYFFWNQCIAKLNKMNTKAGLVKTQNARFKNIIKNRYSFYKIRYQKKIILDIIDLMLVLLKSDTYKVRELIINYRTYIEKIYGSRGEFIKLDKEIELLTAYSRIIQLKYDEKIKISIFAQGDFSGINIPCMILEPIIENSIIHGILPKALGGIIFIRVEIFQDMVSILIEDTGIGMDYEKLNNLLDNNFNSLCKIYKRLKKIYRDSFKMQIESTIEEGTSVNFHLPVKVKGLPEYKNRNHQRQFS